MLTRNKLRESKLSIDLVQESLDNSRIHKLCGSKRPSRNASPVSSPRYLQMQGPRSLKRKKAQSRTVTSSREPVLRQSRSKRHTAHNSRNHSKRRLKERPPLYDLDDEDSFPLSITAKSRNMRVTRSQARANPALSEAISDHCLSAFTGGSIYNSIFTAPAIPANEQSIESYNSHDLFLDDLQQHIDTASADLGQRNAMIAEELSAVTSTPIRKSKNIIKKLDPTDDTRTSTTEPHEEIEHSKQKCKPRGFAKMQALLGEADQDINAPPEDPDEQENASFNDLSEQERREMKINCLRSVLESLTASDIEEDLLCCRVNERKQIERIIYKQMLYLPNGKSIIAQEPDMPKNMSLDKGDFIYLCGQPGTGKTTMMRTILKVALRDGDVRAKAVFLNIMAYGRVSSILESIVTTLEINMEAIGLSHNLLKSIEPEMFCSFLQKYIELFDLDKLIFVFDEIDQYTVTGQLVLFSELVNALAHIPQVCVVGIANSIEFLEFNSCTLFPKHKIVFGAYTQNQLYEIVNARLVSAVEPFALHLKIKTQELMREVFDQTALRFCTLKLSKMSPDLRKVIEIAIEAINRASLRISGQLAEDELGETAKFGGNMDELSLDFQPETGSEELKESESQKESKSEEPQKPNTDRVTVQDFQAAIQNKFESRVRRVINSLPKGRVVLIKAIEECFTNGRQKMVDDIFMGYTRLLSKMQLSRVSFQEMMDGLVSLEFYGLISIKTIKKQATSFQKSRQVINLEARLDEIQQGLADFGGFLGEKAAIQLQMNGGGQSSHNAV